MNSKTYFSLLIEYETTDIPVVDFASKRFGYDELVANRKAKEQAYPFPVYRLGGQKSPWLVSIQDAADYIDKMKKQAKADYESVRSAPKTHLAKSDAA